MAVNGWGCNVYALVAMNAPIIRMVNSRQNQRAISDNFLAKRGSLGDRFYDFVKQYKWFNIRILDTL